jgi:uridylate kinase
MTTQPRYSRILLKLSGEALLGDQQYGVDPKVVAFIAEQVRSVRALGVEVGIVVGGGNIFRGLAAANATGMERATADHIGMLATVMNGLAIQDGLERAGVETRVMTAIEMNAARFDILSRGESLSSLLGLVTRTSQLTPPPRCVPLRSAPR